MTRFEKYLTILGIPPDCVGAGSDVHASVRRASQDRTSSELKTVWSHAKATSLSALLGLMAIEVEHTNYETVRVRLRKHPTGQFVVVNIKADVADTARLCFTKAHAAYVEHVLETVDFAETP